eukprot:Skav229473  [mRNA]  locus=scaffold4865:5622:9102:- [translate_table: standard]
MMEPGRSPGVRERFTDREIFAALLAAAAHDVGHDGKTGRGLGSIRGYHTGTESPLALLYNDSSVTWQL